MKKLEELLEWGGVRKDIALLILSGLALLVSILWGDRLPVDPAWVAIVLCGLPIVLEAIIGLVTAFDIKADVLVSIALVASVVIGEDFAAGEVAFIMQLGALLEDLTVARARAGIEKLVKLTPRTARRLTGAGEEVVPAEEIRVGELLRVLPGETIPVDGVVKEGRSSVDQAVMTGESLPVDKAPGDPVSSGTVNQYGAFTMEATRVGEDSAIQRMVRLVQSADAGKAKIVGLADRWATWIVVIALSAAAITGFVTGELIRAVTILVVFCPCALVLATPTAIMAAIGNATRHGFLVREGDALERLASVQCVAFDKTGTLTLGQLRVTAVLPLNGRTEEQVWTGAVGLESWSEHPLGKAVTAGGRERFPHLVPAGQGVEVLPGLGLKGVVDGVGLWAGNLALMEQLGVPMPPEAGTFAQARLDEGCTLIYLAEEGTLIGVMALADTLRPDAAETIRAVKSAGVQPVLLTGDHPSAAGHIAGLLDIREVQAGCLPEDKLNWIAKSQQQGRAVCMIGDGINDAPALKKAMVGIAMGNVGSDIAVDAADMALVGDDLRQLPHLLRLARRMMVTIKCNLTFSMALNFAAIALAITGILNPVVGALVHNAGSVVVIVNSALLLRWHKRA
ncbi:heavy metal translocating P-type ATPase [uncultured Flavonifractor sp.]|uniref:Cd(2+)-exporting ATPase n=1 Tax=Candidatus Flavonifractor intestinigallinarum TaxID=2838586 RepID=A0A9D2MM78_9FIRM|nr:cation-translocating P-type ATPase [uncultured Flavonifractor sp.]HJB80305.1 cation-translocating P-type ATPase [Candidatus Flavonifractor intestinigallinarum]